MTHVFIIGYPRTATSGLYKIACKHTDLCIYEPFNPNVLYDILVKKKHVHDRVGVIEHTYSKLPRYLVGLINVNSTWAEEWSASHEPPRTPYLGHYWKLILDELLMGEKPTTIKDVYAWPYIPRIIPKYSNTLFIIPVREMEYVYKSFLNWYKNRHPITWFIRRILVKSKKNEQTHHVTAYTPSKPLTRRIRDTIKERVSLYKTLSPKSMMGVAVFYKYYYGSTPRFYPVFLLGHRLLKKMIYTTYRKYMELANKYKDKDNVLVVKFHDKLPKTHMLYIENKIVEWIKR